VRPTSEVATPRVTVIIATYNWSTVLPYSIGSVLRQTLSDFELLVIGDGCTDESGETVTRFDDPRVRWLNLSANTGHQCGPNNEGLRQARSNVIAYLGHDDLWLPRHLELLVTAIEAGADLACGITAMIAPSGSRTYAPNDDPSRRSIVWDLPPTGLVHRREPALEVGGWRHPSELPLDPEIDLVARMRAAGSRLAFVPRLTAVKFPASLRRNVYQLRRADEQATWFARIGQEPDFEQRELAALLLGVERRVRVLVPKRIRRRLQTLRSWLIPHRQQRAAITRRRRTRGLPPSP